MANARQELIVHLEVSRFVGSMVGVSAAWSSALSFNAFAAILIGMWCVTPPALQS